MFWLTHLENLLKSSTKTQKIKRGLKNGRENKKRRKNQVRMREKRKEKELKSKILAEKVGTDEPMISKFENYKCLPIPPMLNAICKELDCEIKDIYEDSEIYLQPSKSKNTEKQESDFYPLSVRLPKSAKDFFKKSLKKCGYKDITYWVWRCYERLQKQFEIIEKAEKEKDRADANTSDTVKGIK